eukprot:m.124048 g.124048  ORF g.124048 m.124048 type:complete len:365 (-) comp16611_c0_seq6:354-1448(-)
MAPVTVCLVGLGRAGTFHMQSLDALGNKKARLCYAVDCDEERAKAVAERYNCTALTSLDKALEDPDLQAVIVASTTHAHFDQVVAALKAKKAVLTEKPISHDHTKLKFAIELALEQRVPFLVGFQRRFDESFRSLRKQLQQGSVGSPRIVKATSRDNPLPPIEYLKISGGLFHDMLCHDFDMIHFLTGQVPVSVYTVGHAYEDAVREMDDIDTCLVTMSFESGLVASVDCSRISSYGYDQRIEVFGDQGMLEVHNHRADTVRLSTASGHTDAVVSTIVRCRAWPPGSFQLFDCSGLILAETACRQSTLTPLNALYASRGDHCCLFAPRCTYGTWFFFPPNPALLICVPAGRPLFPAAVCPGVPI